jgi:RNA polymerase sigma-70 factor (ECF subfamily)
MGNRTEGPRINGRKRGNKEVMDPRDLLNRCQNGDELAWEVLVRQHQGRVCSIAFGYVGDQDEARDLAQEIFVRVYQSLDSCEDPDRFQYWLTRIARNACIDHLRRRKARPPRQDIPAEDLTSLSDGRPTPEDDWVRSSRKRLVYSALQKLSEINREIILLKDIQDMPLDEIAEMLDLPVGTVKSRSSRARVELAQVITGLDGGPGGSGLGAEAVS